MKNTEHFEAELDALRRKHKIPMMVVAWREGDALRICGMGDDDLEEARAKFIMESIPSKSPE